MKRKRLFYLFLCFFLITGFLMQSIPRVAYASSWTDGLSTGIYGSEQDINPKEIKEDTPNFIIKAVIQILVAVGTGLENMFNLCGISLNRIIYGRVNGHSINNVALFTFELKEGNPYGLVGAIIYQVFRMVSYGIIIAAIYCKLNIYQFRRKNAQFVAAFRGELVQYVLIFFLLATMPYILDVVLYLRDVILYAVTSVAGQYISGGRGELDIIELFRDEAKNSIVSALVYIASVCFSLYLAFLYTGYALCFTICFAFFPFVAFSSVLKRDMLGNWVSTVAYYIAIPVLDGGLLLVPAVMLHKVPDLIVIFTCFNIVPARSIISQLLGIQERGSGLMGMAAIMSAGRLIGSVVGAGKKVAGGVKGARDDQRMAQYESDMAYEESRVGHETQQPVTESIGSSAQPSSAWMNTAVSSSETPASNVTVSEPVSGAESGQYSSASASSVSTSSIADYYADKVSDWERSPLSGQISHAKRAELYKERSKNRMKQALGSAAGSLAGGMVGFGAGMMMGPAVSAATASMGIDAGSSFGGFLAQQNIPSLYRTYSTISGNAMGSVVGQVSAPSGATMQFPSVVPSGGSSASMETGLDVVDIPIQADVPLQVENSVIELGTSKLGEEKVKIEADRLFQQNSAPMADTFNSLNDRYIDDSYGAMGQCYNELDKKYRIENIPRDHFRAEFRSRISQQYMAQFKSKIHTHPNYSEHGEADVMDTYYNSCKKQADSMFFQPDSKGSFVSDEALDSYDWFNY